MSDNNATTPAAAEAEVTPSAISKLVGTGKNAFAKTASVVNTAPVKAGLVAGVTFEGASLIGDAIRNALDWS